MKQRSGHVIMCGYTSSTKAALAELADLRDSVGVVLLSKNTVPQMDGVTHLPLDYLHLDALRDRRVGLDTCSMCVVFAEAGNNGGTTADMHTVLAVYNVKKAQPHVPVIAEIVDRENSTFIDELGCTDIIYKETIDSNLITSCILHPNISPIFYDLLTVRGKVLKTTTLVELGLNGAGEGDYGDDVAGGSGRPVGSQRETDGPPVSYRDVRLKGLELDVTFLGYIDNVANAVLMPPNDTLMLPRYRLVYIE